MSKKKSFIQVELDKPVFRSNFSWENIEDDDSVCLDPEIIARIRSELPSAPRAVRNQVDASKVPEQGPFAVRVSNLAFTCSRFEVESFFQHLRPAKVVLSTNRSNSSDSGSPLNRGWAIIEFTSRRDAIQALDLNGRNISNRSVRIEPYKYDRQSSASGFKENSLGNNESKYNRVGYSRPMNRPMQHVTPQTRSEPMSTRTANTDENWRRREPVETNERVASNKAAFAWGSRETAPYNRVQVPPDMPDSIEPRTTEKAPMSGMMRAPPPRPQAERRTHLDLADRVPPPRNARIFGSARPVDTYRKEIQIHQKWEEQRQTFLMNGPMTQMAPTAPWKRPSSMPQPPAKSRITHTSGPIPSTEAERVRRIIAPPPAVNFWEARRQAMNVTASQALHTTTPKEVPGQVSQAPSKPETSRPVDSNTAAAPRNSPKTLLVSSRVKFNLPASLSPQKSSPPPQRSPAAINFIKPNMSYSSIVRTAPKVEEANVTPPASKSPPPTAPPPMTLKKRTPPDVKTKKMQPPRVTFKIANKEDPPQVASLKSWDADGGSPPATLVPEKQRPKTPPPLQAKEHVFVASLSEAKENIDALVISQANESLVNAPTCTASENTVTCLFSPTKQNSTTSPISSQDKENTIATTSFPISHSWREFVPSMTHVANDMSLAYTPANNIIAFIPPPIAPVLTSSILQEKKNKPSARLPFRNKENLYVPSYTPAPPRRTGAVYYPLKSHNDENVKVLSDCAPSAAAQARPMIKNRIRAVVSYKLGQLLSEAGEPIGPAVPDFPSQKNISCSTAQDKRYKNFFKSSCLREVSGAGLQQNRKKRFPNRPSGVTNTGTDHTDQSNCEPVINVLPHGGWSENDFPPMCDPQLPTSDKPVKVMEESFSKWDEFSQSSKKDRKTVSFDECMSSA